jgi:hypothetical protein
MIDLRANYTQEDAVADGVLIDVSEAARAVDISVPVYMTAGLWRSTYIERLMERVCVVLNLGPLRHDIRIREFGRTAAPIVNKCFPRPFYVYFELEPSPESGVVVTVTAEAERLKYDLPRTGAGGSFYVV